MLWKQVHPHAMNSSAMLLICCCASLSQTGSVTRQKAVTADGSILPLLQMEMPAWITHSDFERAELLSHLIGALTAHSSAT